MAISIVLLAGCAKEEGSAHHFFAAKSQPVETTLTATDSADLTELNVFTPDVLFSDEENLYVDGYQDIGGKVLVLDKETLTRKTVVGREEGHGPGEVRAADVAVARGRIAVYSENQRKIAVYDTSGTWITDLQPEIAPFRVAPFRDRLIVLGTNRIIKHQQTRNQEENKRSRPRLFRVLTMDGEVTSRFGRAGPPEVARSSNPMAYMGTIAADPNETALYFGGRGEHILKKYEIGNEPAFSVETVNPFPSANNYMTGEQGPMWAFSEYAVFAIEDLSVAGGRVYVRPARENADRKVQPFIDVYGALDGTYVRSYRTPRWSQALSVDSNRAYTLERFGESMYLKAYAIP